jgi:hypothetical protein
LAAARTYEMSVDIQLRTWQYIPEDSGLHTCHRENLKSHKMHDVGVVLGFGAVVLYVNANVLKTHALSTLRAEVTKLEG